jgi:gliding motility-associated-like protein
MKTIFTILLIVSATLAMSQEICDNGIDDDGDGLIDLNDTTDCYCTPVSIPSLIPNPSFEEHTGCPYSISQLNFSNDWIQAGAATTDYYHNCGYTAETMLPFPDGDACVGMFFADSWSEYAGACLSSPMQAGVDYTIEFNVGFSLGLNPTNPQDTYNPYTPVAMTLYGTSDCADLPFPFWDACPIGYNNWQELGYVLVDPQVLLGTWDQFSISFTPDIDFYAIMLGPPCELPSSGEYTEIIAAAPYFYLDNLVLNKSESFGISIEQSGDYCAGNLLLSVSPDTSGIIQWYRDGIAISGENDTILDISGNTYPAATYQVTFSCGGICQVAEINVNENAVDIFEISDAINSCDAYVLPEISGENMSGNQNYYSAPGGQGDIVTSPVTSSQTIYIYDNQGYCSDEESFSVTIYTDIEAYAGEDIQICGNHAILNADLILPNSTGYWTGDLIFNNPNDESTIINADYGVYQLIWTENFEECFGTDSVIVTFLETPSPIINTAIDSICGNIYSLNVLNTNFSGKWVAYTGNPQQLLVPAPNYYPSSNSPQAIASIGNFNNNILTVNFVWEETNSQFGQECTVSVNTEVSFLKSPVASVGADNEAEICGNCYNELHADITGSEWAEGLWISPIANCSWTNQNSPQADVCFNEQGIFGDSAHFRTPLLWTVSNYFCSDIDTMWITLYEQPKANAGLDGAICGLNYNLEAFYDLTENSEYSPSGIWSVYSGPTSESAVIATIYDSNSEVQVSHTGIWEFAFRENNSLLTSCYDTDIVLVEFLEVPVVYAGPDADVCGKHAVLDAVSGGFTGTWTPTSGSNFVNYSDPNSDVYVGESTTYTFIWLESNQATTSTLSCTSIDEVQITFYPQPEAEILTDEEDNTTCGRRFLNLRAELPGTGIRGYWYDTYPGTIYENYDSVSTWAEVYTYGCHDFYWIEESGPELSPGFCSDTAGPLNICFIEIPVANAGIDTLFCGLTGFLEANPTVGTGIWSDPSNQNIEIISPNNPNSQINSIIYNTDEESEEHFTLIWTEDNGNGCADSDEVEVVFAEIPNSSTLIVPPKCFGESATISAVDDELNHYTWNFFTGTINSSSENAVGGTYINMVNWDNEDENHIFSLFTTNMWGCQSPINIDTITEPTIPTFDYIIIQDTCLMGKGGFEFAETENNSFFWLDTIYGPPSGSSFTTVYDIPAGSYSIRNSYLTSNIEHYSYYISTFGTANCVDTVVYDIEPIGLINAEISVSADIILETLVAPNASVIFLNTSDYDDISKRCEWHFDDETILKSCDELVEHIYTKAGCYNPFLIVMNRDLPECRDTAYLETCVFVDNASKLEIPNIFSPNADGNNDYFQVKAQSLRNFSGIIVNRWGRTIFEWTNWQDYESGWDGKINRKSDASPGVYFYIIQAEGFDGTIFSENGTVTLMRE